MCSLIKIARFWDGGGPIIGRANLLLWKWVGEIETLETVLVVLGECPCSGGGVGVVCGKLQYFWST